MFQIKFFRLRRLVFIFINCHLYFVLALFVGEKFQVSRLRSGHSLFLSSWRVDLDCVEHFLFVEWNAFENAIENFLCVQALLLSG